eukprot:Sdes_comp19870_c0_seq5m12149
MNSSAPSEDAQKLAKVIASSQQILQQLVNIIQLHISDENYTFPSSYNPSGTIGKHIRHSLDHWNHILNYLSKDSELINYDNRKRGNFVESDRQFACKALLNTCDNLGKISPFQLSQTVEISVMVPNCESHLKLSSTLAREIWFACHHAIHHCAMIKNLLKEFGCNFEGDEIFGYVSACFFGSFL